MKKNCSQLQWACDEASRCLFCLDAPCVEGCPAHIDIPLFIRLIRWRDLKGAKKVIRSGNYFGSVCGYLCPSEELCEKKCVHGEIDRPLSIAALQKFACDHASYDIDLVGKDPSGKRVAIIGAGPAGLSCAIQLREFGHEVEVFEKEPFLAGTITKEIPLAKIPQEVVDKELQELAVDKLNVHLGVQVTDEFFGENIENKFDAIFIGIGLSRARRAGLNEQKLRNVYNASAFLSLIKQGEISQVEGVSITIGGGNTAIDCAVTALCYGAQRSIVAYRRSGDEMPADEADFLKAVKKGVEFMWMVSPSRLVGEQKLSEVVFLRTILSPAQAGGRKKFVLLSDSEFAVPADILVFALGKDRGHELDSLLGRNEGSVGDNNFRLGKSNIFAGGDCVNHRNTVVEAMIEGRLAAREMHSYLDSSGE